MADCAAASAASTVEEPESAAFLQIDEVRQGERNSVVSQQVFSGWMFASSPALSALENPIYDVGVLDCKTDTTAAPSASLTLTSIGVPARV